MSNDNYFKNLLLDFLDRFMIIAIAVQFSGLAIVFYAFGFSDNLMRFIGFPILFGGTGLCIAWMLFYLKFQRFGYR